MADPTKQQKRARPGVPKPEEMEPDWEGRCDAWWRRAHRASNRALRSLHVWGRRDIRRELVVADPTKEMQMDSLCAYQPDPRSRLQRWCDHLFPAKFLPTPERAGMRTYVTAVFGRRDRFRLLFSRRVQIVVSVETERDPGHVLSSTSVVYVLSPAEPPTPHPSHG